MKILSVIKKGIHQNASYKTFCLVTLPLAIAFALCVWLEWVPYPFLTKRSLGITFLLICFFSVLLTIIFNRWLNPIWKSASANLRLGYLLLSAIFAALTVITGLLPLQNRAFFLPNTSLEIRATGTNNERSSGTRVALTLFDSGTTDSFSAFTRTGDWKQKGDHLFASDDAKLTWTGSVFQRILLVFEGGPQAGQVIITFLGNAQMIDLYAAASGNQEVSFSFPVPFWNRWLILIVNLFTDFFVLLLFISWILHLQPRSSQLQHVPILFRWMPLMIMVLVWSICLLAFWPGIMTLDSLDQWGQAVSGQINNRHPAFYALLMRWFWSFQAPPSALAFFQIMILALVANSGIQMLINKGLPLWIGVVFSIVFACWPFNLFFPITLWKDILYGTAELALFLILFNIFTQSSSNPPPKPRSTVQFVGTIAAGLSICLFRHNGFPVVIILFLILILFCKTKRRWSLSALAVIAISYVFIVRIIYPHNTISGSNSYGINQGVLHAISAHVANNTTLKPEEQNTLNQILPAEQWIYDPCVVNTLWSQPSLNSEEIARSSKTLVSILFRLSITNPKVTVRHLLDSSRMIWQVQRGGCYLFRIGVNKSADGQLSWVSSNHSNIQAESKIPPFTNFLYRIFGSTAGPAGADAIFWRPAIYAYFALFASSVYTLRCRKKSVLTISLVTLVQTCLMLFITIAQDVRYQYGVMLIGLFCLPILFLPANTQVSERNV